MDATLRLLELCLLLYLVAGHFLVWFWEDTFLIGYFHWILLATIAVCILINIALGEFICVIEENGMRSRRFVGVYRLYSYEEINEYARLLRPFCYKNYLYIYIDYSYFEQQMNGDRLENSNMYGLMLRMEGDSMYIENIVM